MVVMVSIAIDITKSVDKNASAYYDKAKKFKKKLAGAEEALKKTKIKLTKLEKQKKFSDNTLQQQEEVKSREKKWYEKFRWFISSEGFLVIGGRDATTNDIIVKKHTEPDDVVFHTEMPGSPFCVIKTEGKKPGKATLEETAQFCAVNSRAFRRGLLTTEVYHIKPEQVSKEAQSGEYLGKGSFMIYGKKNYINAEVKTFIGILEDGAVMSASETAVKKHCKAYVGIVAGNSKKSEVAKKLQRFFESRTKLKAELDEIMQALPPGDCKIV
ncbi:hypothetical protein CMO89_02825 [Candidatus Woesearchaeota archaeon]|jgi:predicted ribosome quality control (RQC) complex YloA/Tae2 family protein|nr:hypothetical protein [Candidatus Woesearchaeota archaeon]|tara:strand:- start:1752 stop:2561 length:810 start_codon:yes stop_codon:yes gene_type:complete